VFLEEGNEPRKQQAGVVQLETQAAAKLEILGQRFAQPVHDALPGHGSAKARKAATSTLA